MKPIDSNQQRILSYLLSNGRSSYKDLMPLMEYYDDQQKAYLAAVTKLSQAHLITSRDKGEQIEWEVTTFGEYNYG